MPMANVLVDSIYMEAYKRILKRVIYSVWSSSIANEIYAKLTHRQIKNITDNMQDFTSATCRAVLKCMETQMKAQSLLTKYQLPLECAPDETRAFQSIIESLIETGKYKTSSREEYELAYYPILRGTKLSHLGYPSEREFIICYKEEKGVVSVPNRIYLKVKSDLLQVSTSISNSDIR
eukprot:TRINITY_DN10478_c0_g2_i4.p2 TRINITY_DN10478_c0_g2~~TRINITY_DN10478_c0_g2_i4.p2  ORF type:complete len:178 (-),score=40.10 TRINITY_DN10478_c0_g2_i4:165-698(-)